MQSSLAGAPSTILTSLKWLTPLLLCPLILWGCWSAPLAELDDPVFIAGNRALKASSPWSDVFSRDIDLLYMPLSYLSLRIDRVVYEPLLTPYFKDTAWATGIRTTNLLLHILAAVLVFWLARGLGFSRALAGFITTAFALHPTVCQAVCWPIERKTILAAVFGYAAIGVYIRGTSWRHCAGSAVLHGLALLSKPSAMGLLPVVLVWEILGRPKLDPEIPDGAETSTRSRWYVSALMLAPWLLAAGAAFVNQLEMVGPVKTPLIGGSYWTVMLTDIPVLQRYVVNYLWPAQLSAEYGLAPVLTISDPRFWICFSTFAGLVVGTFWLAGRLRWRMVAFGWLAFVGALGPALNFVGKNNLMEDCHGYLSTPFFWSIVALSGNGAAQRLRLSLPARFAPVTIALIACALSVASFSRGYLFRSTEALFEDASVTEPRSALARLIFAQMLRRKGDQEMLAGDTKAEMKTRFREMKELERGIAANLFDRSRLVTSAYTWLGRSYYEHGRPDDALKMFELAKHSPQGNDSEHAALIMRISGLIAFDGADFERALRLYDAAIKLMPNQTYIWIDRTRALLALADLKRKTGDSASADIALASARDALKAVPENDPVHKDLETLLGAAR